MRKTMIMFMTILLLGGCAVMEEKEPLTDEEVMQEMLEYAEKKYDKDFEVSGEFMHVNNSKTSPFTVQLKTEGSKGRYDVFTVKRTRKGSKISYEDNYSNIHYRELAYNEIEPIVKKYIEQSNIIITLIQSPREETNISLTYEKAFEKGYVGMADIVILVSNSEYMEELLKSKFDEIYKELFSKYDSAYLALYTLNADDCSSIKVSSRFELFDYFYNDYLDAFMQEKSESASRTEMKVYWSDSEVITNER